MRATGPYFHTEVFWASKLTDWFLTSGRSLFVQYDCVVRYRWEEHLIENLLTGESAKTYTDNSSSASLNFRHV